MHRHWGWGVVSREKGARSMGEERKKGKIIIILNKKLTGKINMKKKTEKNKIKTYHNVGVSNVSACMGV